jgi:hypothetical protein
MTSIECECESNFTCGYCVKNAKPYFFTPSTHDTTKNTMKLNYKSLAAQQAQKANYGTQAYWDYLDKHAQELLEKGVVDALTRSLADALKGNDGD